MLPLDHIIVTTIPRTHAYICGFCRTPLPLDAWDACPCRSPQAPPSSWKTRFERPAPHEHDPSDALPQRDPLSTACGILVGVALSLVAWAVGIVVFVALWR
jgi:hypothetical protein